MKKIYTVMAAVATTLTMVAAPGQHVISQKIEKETATEGVSPVREAGTIIRTKAPATPDLNNYWSYTYFGMTSQNNTQQFQNIQLEQVSETEVNIYGLFYYGAVKATYDPAEMTLTVLPQEVLSADWSAIMFGLDEPINLYLRNNSLTTEINSVTFSYAPNGVQFEDGSIDFIGGWMPNDVYDILMFVPPSFVADFEANPDAGMSGFVLSWQYATFFYPLEDMYPEAGAFTFNESEWTNIGNSSFFDGWVVGAGREYSPELCWDVVTYRNIEDPNVFLLYQPYGPNSLASIEGLNKTPNAEGYIYIDANEPDCVLVRPNILSGFANEDMVGMNCTLALTSYEGFEYYFEGYYVDEIIDEAEMWGDELSTITEDGLITIPRARFGIVPYLENETYWISDSQQALEMRTIIQLPVGAGVEGIESDINAPVKYYNLQGVEIKNPEKGQIVIKKQGKEVSKIMSK